MSYRRLVTLLDVARAGYFVKLTCPCGHVRRLDPMKVAMRLVNRGADLRLTRLKDSLRCGKCGGKDFTTMHCEGPAIWSDTGRPATEPRKGEPPYEPPQWVKALKRDR